MMPHRIVLIFALIALLAASSGTQLTAQRVVDLTNVSPSLAEWKIVGSEAGGPVGTWPIPASHVPVTLRLTGCALSDSDLLVSVEISNNRKSEIQVPIGMNTKLFEHRGKIAFRELLIHVGTATDTEDASTFKAAPILPSITLFGDPSIPSTVAVLAPGERLLLRLRFRASSKHEDLSKLRVNTGAFDVTLSPGEDGYKKREIWIPAFSANSEPTCLESK